MCRPADLLVSCLVLAGGVCLWAQPATTWQDPSPHKAQLVTVDDNVQLEVLDWGGSGRPIVLLAGSGNTAHVFDEFAPRLVPEGHVYGITRRGYGMSTPATSGYTADRLGEDVGQVLDALSLSSAILIGHSIAGQELSFLASRTPKRLSGVVYLEAAYFYAFQPPSPPSRPTPPQTPRGTPLQSPSPRPDDLKDIAAFRAWSRHYRGFALPESEVRQTRSIAADGSVGPVRTPASVGESILAGRQRFSELKVPVLAIFAIPHDLGPWAKDDQSQAEAIARFIESDGASTERQAAAFETGVPGAKVIRIPNANHYVFLSHEGVVLREIGSFLESLR